MKLIVILLAIPFLSYSQETSLKYTDIVKVDSATRDQLYNRAKKWFAIQYKSSNDVLQLDNKEDGELIGKGAFNVAFFGRSPYIYHTISISVKDGKYKYTISDYSYNDNQGKEFAIENFPKGWTGKQKLLTKIDEETKAIIASLTRAMMAKDAMW